MLVLAHEGAAAHPGGFLAALADGSIRFIAASIDSENFLRLLMMADGKPVNPYYDPLRESAKRRCRCRLTK